MVEIEEVDLVGKTVKKQFEGFGVFCGVIESFDRSSGFFKVLYEDGDSEEMEFNEIVSLLPGNQEMGSNEQIEKRKRERKPKKRHRKEEKQEICDIVGDFAETMMKESDFQDEFVRIQMETSGFGGDFAETKKNYFEGGFAETQMQKSGSCRESAETQLQESGFGGGFEETQMQTSDFCGESAETQLQEGGFGAGFEKAQMGIGGFCRGSLETQMQKSGSCRESAETQLQESGFGGGFEETQMQTSDFCGESAETQLQEGGFGAGFEKAQMGIGGFCRGSLETQVRGIVFDGDIAETQMNSEVMTGDFSVNQSKGSDFGKGFAETHETDCSFGGDKEENKKNDCRLGEKFAEIAITGVTEETQTKNDEFNGDFAEIQLKENDFIAGSVDNQSAESCFGAHDKEEQGKIVPEKYSVSPYPTPKRRKLSENTKSSPDIVLRRSSRRAAAALCSLNPISDTEKLPADLTTNSSLSDIDCVASIDKRPTKEQLVLLQKFPLPHSSKNLNIDELPILDLFSVYSCLRSFSTSLFLSPFSLEAFVASLKCKFANSLIDSLHFSLLQALKRHLEFLSVEGPNSATTCLRSLDWGLLDLVTWPVCLVEYLLICGSGLMSGLGLGQLKLLDCEYYKQPAGVKLAVLRCLCDDVVEVEDIRSELNRRAMVSELYADTEWNGNIESCKRKKDFRVGCGLKGAKVCSDVEDLGISSLIEEVVEVALADPVQEDGDGNSDECCLCKMDGSLICCDGCPAAYHSKCVGITKELLPEGDWYCPECLMEKQDGWLKSSKPLQGAELLGIDHFGCQYFSSCGYLLVSDSCDAAASSYYFNREDLRFVLDGLKSSDMVYGDIINAISTHWDIPVDSIVTKGQSNLENCMLLTNTDTSNQNSVSKVIDERKSMKKSATSKDCFHQISESATRFCSVSVNQAIDVSIPLTGSEGFSEMSQSTMNKKQSGSELLHSDDAELVLKPTDQNLVLDKTVSISGSGSKNKDGAYTEQSKPDSYVNCYSFGQIASSVAKELTLRSSDNVHTALKRSDSEIISAQLKIISDKCSEFCWSSVDRKPEMLRENCGWCLSCKSEGDGDCLFNMADKTARKNLNKNGAVGLRSKRNKKSHLSSVVRYILSIEERLRGILCGPWENPHYSKHWRKSVLKASNVASVKYSLLTLESNIRRISLSVEWLKQVDYAIMVGSAFHVLTSLADVSAKHGVGRRKSKKNIPHSETILVSDVATRSGIRWWRGGRLSRQVFHWKALPKSLTSKAARQAGCKKIPGIFYLEGSEFAKRSKYVAWRAAVEMSVTVAQLGHQVRDLDSHIKWSDLASTELFPRSAKDVGKSGRPLKKVKVTIRRKNVEGMNVKYLLDFGKRKNIPDTVVKNGIKFEDAVSIREKYWLDECHVPLNLLKAYEEKKQARSSYKKKFEPVCEEGPDRLKPPRKKDFSRLLSKAEKNDSFQCDHCNKDIILREAVSCQLCKGFFHKRHVAASKDTTTAKCTYACYGCRNKKYAKIKNKSQKVRSGKHKTSMKGHPRGIAKRVKYVSLQSKKLNGLKIMNLSNKTAKKSLNGLNMHKRQRTQIYHTYWLNGLHWSRKLNDERGMSFREQNIFLPARDPKATTTHPACFLCHERYDSGLIYVGCQNCEEWFHGDAFGVTAENTINLLGFKCHQCREKSAPTCPYSKGTAIEGAHANGVQKSGMRSETVKNLADDNIHIIDINERHCSLPNEEFQIFGPSEEHKQTELKMDHVLDANHTIMLEKDKTESEMGQAGLEEKSTISELVEAGTHSISSGSEPVLHPQTILSLTRLLDIQGDKVQVLFDMSQGILQPLPCGKLAKEVDYIEDKGFSFAKMLTLFYSKGSRLLEDIGHKMCIVCAIVDVPPDFCCVACKRAVHSHCYKGAPFGVWCNNGWMCDGCKAGIRDGVGFHE